MLPTQYWITSTCERPDLASITARWRWTAFFRDSGEPLEDILAGAVRTAAEPRLMPHTLVLLADNEPIGTASLAAHDLDERPDLSPWLAGVFIVPHARGKGHVAKLIHAVEARAAGAGIPRLWLYTSQAERIYARLGWTTEAMIQHGGRPFALMKRDLEPRA